MKNNKYSLFLLLAAGACYGQQVMFTATPIAVDGLSNVSLIWISDDATIGFGAAIRPNPYGAVCVAYGAPVQTITNCVPRGANVGTYVYQIPDLEDPSVVTPLVAMANGKTTVLTPPTGVTHHGNERVGVNKEGQIAGRFDCPAPSGSAAGSTIPCAYVVSPDGFYTRLSAEGGHAGAYAINESDDVTGWVSPADGAQLEAWRPVIWSYTGKLIDLSTFSDLRGLPVAINATGQVAGTSDDGTLGTAFFYDGAGKTMAIQVAGASSVSPTSLNDRGEIVGSYVSQKGDGISHPFYYYGGSALDLNSVVSGLPGGVTLTAAQYINGVGQILVDAVNANQPVGTITSSATQYLLTPVGNQVSATPMIELVVNEASQAPGISSSSWITIFGVNLATSAGSWNSSDFDGDNLPIQLDGVSVTVNGLPAYPSYVSPYQLNVLAPFDPTIGPVKVQVSTEYGVGNEFTVDKVDLAPAFFQVAYGYPAAVHLNGNPIGPSSQPTGGNFTPAAPGETIQIFGTGFGPVVGAGPDGQVLAAPAQLMGQVTVTIGGKPATVIWAGMVSAGLDQLNVTIPEGLPDGDFPIVATVGGVSTQPEVVIGVRN